ncbi:peptidase dimerization domain-containing protein [Streptomyces sp. H27-S2]|uniref:peptidase dimerization domain-containing protein n=1 Tax=Streptomyces antarcticus TaxID=2996458 RepID=UPI002D1E43C5|nr:peptidase dimerization domain-containing protein [Streptomyces sp. H27-S2]
MMPSWHVVTRLQSVVARETAPADQVAVTVGAFHAGERANVIPDRAELALTVRAVSGASLERAARAVERIVRAECAAADCPRKPDVVRVPSSPAVTPDPAVTEAVRGAHRAEFGAERVAAWPASPATEDFGLFGEAGRELHGASGVGLGYWMLGTAGMAAWSRARAQGSPLPSNHPPDFAPDARTALPAGVRALTAAALCRLGGAARGGPASDGRA